VVDVELVVGLALWALVDREAAIFEVSPVAVFTYIEVILGQQGLFSSRSYIVVYPDA